MAKVVTRGLSMAPLILPKDTLIIEKNYEYGPNDIVVFKKDRKFIAHRVIYERFGKIVTKGDRNLKDDGFIEKGEIFGRVTAIRRREDNLLINHFYLSQSSSYLRELSKIAKAFAGARVPYVFIKGLPIHLFIKDAVPKRLYIDADILIKKTSAALAHKVLGKLGFSKVSEGEAFGVLGREPTQLTFYKNISPFPVVVDLHLDIALGFTRATAVNDLLPNLDKFTDLIFKESVSYKVGKVSFRIPKKEFIFIILLIHFFHHNFKGSSSLNFMKEVLAKGKLDFKKLTGIVSRFRLKNFIFPSALIMNKFYPGSLPKDFLEKIKPDLPRTVVSGLFSLISWPFSEEERVIAGMKRFMLIIILSPKKVSDKLKILFKKELIRYYFVSIRSLFSSSLRKLSRSFSVSSSETSK